MDGDVEGEDVGGEEAESELEPVEARCMAESAKDRCDSCHFVCLERTICG